MKRSALFIALALAAGSFSVSTLPAHADGKQMSCDSIMRICMKRAPEASKGICEDMYSQAKNTGVWPAATDENGKQHPATKCSR